MFQLLSVAWSAYKLGLKRFGPAGSILFAVAISVGFVYLRRYLAANYPGVRRKLDETV